MKLTFRTSFLNLSLTLFETDDAEAAAVYGNTLGQYEIAPEAEIEYEPDEPEAFGFCV